MKLIVKTDPVEEAILYDTIKITVDGPREPRKRRQTLDDDGMTLCVSQDHFDVLAVTEGCYFLVAALFVVFARFCWLSLFVVSDTAYPP